jgi:hypothetical protein
MVFFTPDSYADPNANGNTDTNTDIYIYRHTNSH